MIFIESVFVFENKGNYFELFSRYVEVFEANSKDVARAKVIKCC